MKFCEYLKLLNCYMGTDKNQSDFIYYIFSIVICDPKTDSELELDNNDEYYPFSELTDKDTCKKIYSGKRGVPKAIARFVKSHFISEKLYNMLNDFSDEVLDNLCKDLNEARIKCNIDNVCDIVPKLFLDFMNAAIDEKDYVETEIVQKANVSIESRNASNDDVLFLTEVSNICPLCGKSLIKRKKENILKQYKITSIFPQEIDDNKYERFYKIKSFDGDYESPNNLIALCTECATSYLSNPSEKEYDKLKKLKDSFQNKEKTKGLYDDISIEHDINEIISALIKIERSNNSAKLEMNALKVDKKIKGNILLVNTITDDVVRYYKYIEELFVMADDKKSGAFDMIAGEFRFAYLKLNNNNNLSQEDIFDSLIDWVVSKVSINFKNRIAVRIIVSFFVQNCEVFDEVS